MTSFRMDWLTVRTLANTGHNISGRFMRRTRRAEYQRPTQTDRRQTDRGKEIETDTNRDRQTDTKTGQIDRNETLSKIYL